MNNQIDKFKKGIFSLFTRRFGTVAEYMIEALCNFKISQNQFHDRYDDINSKRIEIKFSRVMKSNDEKIKKANIVEQILYSGDFEKRYLSSEEVSEYPFDCNIQQIKAKEFDILYYGLFFSDKIAIFKMTNEEVIACNGYSDKQHKGNTGEGQFHIKNDNYKQHLKNNLVQWLSYDELIDLFNQFNEE